MLRSERRSPRSLLLIGPKRLLCCVALLAGCAAPAKVVSECPEPSPAEAQDLSDWLMEEPDRPAQMWAARVVGKLYPEDLDEIRGEAPEDEGAWGWMMPPWWGDDE